MNDWTDSSDEERPEPKPNEGSLAPARQNSPVTGDQGNAERSNKSCQQTSKSAHPARGRSTRRESSSERHQGRRTRSDQRMKDGKNPPSRGRSRNRRNSPEKEARNEREDSYGEGPSRRQDKRGHEDRETSKEEGCNTKKNKDHTRTYRERSATSKSSQEESPSKHRATRRPSPHDKRRDKCRESPKEPFTRKNTAPTIHMNSHVATPKVNRAESRTPFIHQSPYGRNTGVHVTKNSRSLMSSSPIRTPSPHRKANVSSLERQKTRRGSTPSMSQDDIPSRNKQPRERSSTPVNRRWETSPRYTSGRRGHGTTTHEKSDSRKRWKDRNDSPDFRKERRYSTSPEPRERQKKNAQKERDRSFSPPPLAGIDIFGNRGKKSSFAEEHRREVPRSHSSKRSTQPSPVPFRTNTREPSRVSSKRSRHRSPSSSSEERTDRRRHNSKERRRSPRSSSRTRVFSTHSSQKSNRNAEYHNTSDSVTLPKLYDRESPDRTTNPKEKSAKQTKYGH